MKKLIYIMLLLSFTLVFYSACGKSNDAISAELLTLDSLIDIKDNFEQIKLLRLAELRQRRAQAVTAADRFMFNAMLFDEFLTFKSDSALRYIDENIDIARRSGNRDWLDKSMISKSNLMATNGLLGEAENLMSQIDRATINPDLLVDYYGQMIYLYSHLGNYAGGAANHYYEKERKYKDSIITVIKPEHPEYLWYKGWDVLGTDKSDPKLIPALKKCVDESGKNTRRDAMNSYILAKLYEQEGDKENSTRYMILSAEIDVQVANAEIASLEELAKMVFANGQGDISRAYNYINYSLTKAIGYPNRVRSISITQTLDTISKAFQERNTAQQQRTTMFLWLVGLLSCILAVTVAIIIIQNRRLRRQGQHLDSANKQLSGNITELSEARNQLADANARLKELNTDLQQKNEELNEANYVKEEYIGYIFTICSNYIRKLEELRKSIHVKIMTKKYKEIENETAGVDIMKDELKDFYRSFDTVFLHIYPDFVNDFNSLLQEDKKIMPKEGELLNTELRIYALVRLGITDSVKIAEFLHCSAQTVYNNRFKVRNKANIEKKDFAEAVRHLGKFMERPS